MDLFEAVKQITIDHDKKYFAVFISDPAWEESSPYFDTRQEAVDWLDKQKKISNRPDDWGYVNEVMLEQQQAA